MPTRRPTALAPAALLAAGALSFAPALGAQAVAGAPNTAPPRQAAREPTRLGFSVARLARLDALLDQAVARGEIAGAVVLVTRDGQTAYERAAGWADREAGRRMTPDAIFRIASQTKAVTSVAAMALVEEGRLALHDPVARYVPSFARTTVAVAADTGRAVVPARRPVTVRDLLTHTAGISYGTDSLVAPLYTAQALGPAAGWGWYTADKSEPTCATMERLGGLPFVAQPGERFVYGYATDVLGCVIERASGLPLDRLVAERITGPLRMRDTHFYVPPDKRPRFTAVYASPAAPNGRVVRAPGGARGQGHYVDGPRQSFSGGAGLVSTARDYARFLEMLRRGGALDGARVLAPHTVALMTTNQTDTLFSRAGLGFGLGFETVERAGGGGRVESVGSYGWGGAYGTTYVVDPREGLVVLVMLQQLPNTSDLAGRVRTAVYGALVESRQFAR